MSLTTETTDRNSDLCADELIPVDRLRPDQAPPTVERWLDVMYGIRPNRAVRATFAPITCRYAGGIAEWLGRMWGISGNETTAVTADQWLETMWGIRPGRSFPTTSASMSFCYPKEAGEWLHRLWGLPVDQDTTDAAAA